MQILPKRKLYLAHSGASTGRDSDCIALSPSHGFALPINKGTRRIYQSRQHAGASALYTAFVYSVQTISEKLGRRPTATAAVPYSLHFLRKKMGRSSKILCNMARLNF